MASSASCGRSALGRTGGHLSKSGRVGHPEPEDGPEHPGHRGGDEDDHEVGLEQADGTKRRSDQSRHQIKDDPRRGQVVNSGNQRLNSPAAPDSARSSTRCRQAQIMQSR